MWNGIPMLAPAPEGWEVDIENPTRTSVMEHYLIFGIMGSFATIALMQRFYTKVFLSVGLRIDDRTLFSLHLLFFLDFTFCSFLIVKY